MAFYTDKTKLYGIEKAETFLSTLNCGTRNSNYETKYYYC